MDQLTNTKDILYISNTFNDMDQLTNTKNIRFKAKILKEALN
jgi:hypothetical protein